MSRARGTPAWTAVMSCVLLLAACGSSSSSIDPATARSDISHAYGTLFNFADQSVSSKTAVIENGASLQGTISQALSSSLAKSATGARVDSVQLLPSSGCSQASLASPCAKVVYDIVGANGASLLPTPSTGYAVYRDGKWLVAKSTICSLLGLFYSASGRSGSPPGC